jgi:hypothetical protein
LKTQAKVVLQQFSITNIFSKSVQRVNVTMLEDVKGIPAMQYWAQTERNITVII